MADQVITMPASPSAAIQTEVELPEAESTQLLAANPERAYALISVPAGSTIFLGLGEAATETTGLAIVGGGEPAKVTWNGTLFAICAGAVNVAVAELVYNVGDPTMGNEEEAGASSFVPSGPSDGHPSTDVPTLEPFDEVGPPGF